MIQENRRHAGNFTLEFITMGMGGRRRPLWAVRQHKDDPGGEQRLYHHHPGQEAEERGRGVRTQKPGLLTEAGTMWDL